MGTWVWQVLFQLGEAENEFKELSLNDLRTVLRIALEDLQK
jgi:hypothetical protein